MSYKIVANKFAPKEFGIDINDKNYKKSHSIAYNKCNFNCKFCEFNIQNNRNLFIEYKDEEFKKIVDDLISKGKNFKFTGGEPTLNPKLYEHLKIVKDMGGRVFLDTNGSNFNLVKKLIDDNLVDVLGISIKGLNVEEAIQVSSVKNKNLCWNNVLKTIEYASNVSKVKTIVTLVCYNNTDYERLKKFVDLIFKYKNVFIKINNLFGNRHHSKEELKPVESEKMMQIINLLIKENSKLKNRIIYIDSPKGIENYNNINFM